MRSRRMDALVFNWIGANREPARNPPLGVSIKRSIVSDRESSQGRFNGGPISRDNRITFRVVEKTHGSTNFVRGFRPRDVRDHLAAMIRSGAASPCETPCIITRDPDDDYRRRLSSIYTRPGCLPSSLPFPASWIPRNYDRADFSYRSSNRVVLFLSFPFFFSFFFGITR